MGGCFVRFGLEGLARARPDDSRTGTEQLCKTLFSGPRHRFIVLPRTGAVVRARLVRIAWPFLLAELWTQVWPQTPQYSVGILVGWPRVPRLKISHRLFAARCVAVIIDRGRLLPRGYRPVPRLVLRCLRVAHNGFLISTTPWKAPSNRVASSFFETNAAPLVLGPS
jgi:hypothetical protein